MKFSIKDFVSKCDQIRSVLRIWSHLLKKSLMENFIFCVVWTPAYWQYFDKVYISHGIKTGLSIFMDWEKFN